MTISELMDNNISWNDELYHFGVKGMKWGHRKNYQKVARSLGGSRFAKNAIKNSRYLNSNGKKQALDENAYLAAKKKQKKTGGTITYDTSTGKYSVSKGEKKRSSDNKKKAIKIGAAAAGTVLAAYGSYKVSKFIKENKSSAFSINKLKKMGIDTFDFDTFKFDTFKFD